MSRINLLPWREELRKQKQQDFFIAVGVGVLFTCIVFAFVYLHFEGMKQYQQRRNNMLTQEIKKVDRKITEIRDIESKKTQLLTKIGVIQQLQESRPQIVHLFDELAKSTPEGVYLSQFKQTQSNLLIVGKAQSNARVSAYMRGIEKSDWLEKPELKVIQIAAENKDGQLNDFTLNAKQGNTQLKSQED